MKTRPSIYNPATLALYIQDGRAELRTKMDERVAAERYAELGKWVTLLHVLHPAKAQGVLAYAR